MTKPVVFLIIKSFVLHLRGSICALVAYVMRKNIKSVDSICIITVIHGLYVKDTVLQIDKIIYQVKVFLHFYLFFLKLFLSMCASWGSACRYFSGPVWKVLRGTYRSAWANQMEDTAKFVQLNQCLDLFPEGAVVWNAPYW